VTGKSKPTTQRQRHASYKSLRIEFDPGAPVTAFAGLALTDKLARRAGLWSALKRALPTRCGYDWTTVVKSLAMGLMTGSRGTHAAEDLRQDPVLQRILGLPAPGGKDRLGAVPEEATIWRALSQLASDGKAGPALERETTRAAARLLVEMPARSLGPEGFVSFFIDGTLLEGTRRREGTKYIGEKGHGLLWTVAFVGPVPVAAHLCGTGEGEGEATAARTLLGRVHDEVLVPAGLKERALLLQDSLHGNGPSLLAAEEKGLHYVVGAGALARTAQVLDEQPGGQWKPSPGFDKRRGAEGSKVIVASLQCEDWEKSRTLVARRWHMPGDLFEHRLAVLTNLTPEHPQLASLMAAKKLPFAEAVLWLYDKKGGCETHFKSLLTDLGLHHPPSQHAAHNTGFYMIGLLAGMLSAITALVEQAASKGPLPTVATLRRRLWALPGWITQSGRTLTVRILGLSPLWHQQIEGFWRRACRC